MSNDKTKWIFDDADAPFDNDKTAPPGEMTEGLDSPAPADQTLVGNDAPTEVFDRGDARDTPEKTQIYSAGRAASHDQPVGFSEDADPVTGWLVVVRGPGLGQSVQIGAGMNAVGRGASASVPLPFGDRLISSEDHVRIIYDDTDRKFYIAHGSGRNLSRVNGQMLANTLPLDDNAVIELSKVTTVVFRAFCSEAFDWTDVQADKAAPE